MSTALATQETTLAVGQFDDGKVELLKRTICKGATNDELELFIHACKRTGLDPFMKQIHAVKRWQDGREVMAIQTGIDGYRLIADRTDRYMPGREPTFEYDKDGFLIRATAYVKKLGKDGTWHEVAATAHWSEYVGTKKDGSPNRMWAEKPHIMLGKCAEALALRRAFPAELSGVYTREEMEQAENVSPPARTAPPPPDPDAQAPAPEEPAIEVEPAQVSAEPSEHEKLIIQLHEAMDAKGYDDALQRKIAVGVLKKHKVATVEMLPVEKLRAWVDAVKAGAFEKNPAAA